MTSALVLLPTRRFFVQILLAAAAACCFFSYAAPQAQAASLTETQIQAILNLLSSFGADSATIYNVEAALRGTTPTPSTPKITIQAPNGGENIPLGGTYDLRMTLSSQIPAGSSEICTYLIQETRMGIFPPRPANCEMYVGGGVYTKRVVFLADDVSSLTPGRYKLHVTVDGNPIINNSYTRLAYDESDNWFILGATSSAATLSVSVDAATPTLYPAAAGSAGVIVGVVKFKATGEDIAVDRVGFTLGTGASSFDVVRVYLSNSAAGGPIGGFATFVGSSRNATAQFLSTSDLRIPQGTERTMYIKADLLAQGQAQPGTPGALVKVGINPDTRGVGMSSGSYVPLLSGLGADVFAGVRIFRSYPVVGSDSLPANGLQDGRLLRFKVAAHSTGPISLTQIGLRIDGLAPNTNGQVDLCAYRDSTYSNPLSFFPTACINGLPITSASQGGYLWFPQPLVIPAGSVYYFELRDSTKGTGLTASGNLVTTLLGQSSYAGVVSATSLVGKDAAFVWSPNTYTTPQQSTSDWTNGYGVLGLPAAGISQTRSGTVSPPPSMTDAQRRADLEEIKDALLTYGLANGTYLVTGSGSNGGGQGWVAYQGAAPYVKAVTTVLREQAYLSRTILETTPNYMLYLCDNNMRFALSATLVSPTSGEIAQARASCNGTGVNGTVDRYGKSYAVEGILIAKYNMSDTHFLIRMNQTMGTLIANKTYVYYHDSAAKKDYLTEYEGTKTASYSNTNFHLGRRSLWGAVLTYDNDVCLKVQTTCAATVLGPLPASETTKFPPTKQTSVDSASALSVLSSPDYANLIAAAAITVAAAPYEILVDVFTDFFVTIGIGQ